MIQSVYIKNFALIDEIKVDFKNGFTVLTGETGSGKSILIEALFFLLGKKGDAKVIREGETKAIIEAEFDWTLMLLEPLFNQNQISLECPIIIRREINLNGRNRAFVNDTPVNNALLKQLALPFIDIHTQHELLEILKSKQQLNFIDSFAGNQPLLETYKLKYHEFKSLKSELQTLIELEKKALLDKDYFSFLYHELEEANVQENEIIELEEELNNLSHAEEIIKSLMAISSILNDDEAAAIPKLKTLDQLLTKNARYFKVLEDLKNRLNSVIIELQDIANEAELNHDKLDLNPARKQTIESRLNLLNQLLHKHQASNTTQLWEKFQEISNKLQQTNNLETDIEVLKSKITKIEKDLIETAKQISLNRHKAGTEFCNQIEKIIHDLGMPHGNFKIDWQKKDEISETGFDDIDFLFSANKGGSLKLLSEAASGGELSRVLLAIKTIIAGKNNLKTIIFDEIDSGVSGEVAHKFGLLFKQMGKKIQVFAITHLPQVAAQGSQHAAILKTILNNKTTTQVRILSDNERITEIAKLISADKLTDAALANAKIMLEA